MILEGISCIHYLLCFYKDKNNKVLALMNLGNKVNAKNSRYASKLDLKICSTNVRAQKNGGFTLKTFGMVLTRFQVKNKLEKARFFQETFLLINTSAELEVEMLFLTFTNIKVLFLKQKLTQKSYTLGKALLNTQKEQFIDKNEFAKTVLNKKYNSFVMHLATLEVLL